MYDGKKFFCASVTTRINEYGFEYEHKEFQMTAQYLKYLRKQQEERDRMHLVQLKHKLEYQRTHYNEVDKYDLDEYMRLIQESYRK